MPSPAQADTPLKWTVVDKPGEEGNIVVSPSEVSEIAIGREGVLYAIDGENPKAYRSLDAGISWENIGPELIEAGAELPASKVAVAPDKPGIVAVVASDGTEVYVSTDGGVTWADTDVPNLTGTIKAIAISNQYTEAGKSFWEIAIGTAAWSDGATTGQIWILQLGKSWVSWQNQNLAIDPAHIGGEVSALVYSPKYKNDKTILAVCSTGRDVTTDYQNKTWLCLGKRDISARTTSWHNLTGYPVEIASAGDATGVSWIRSSLALPSNYSGDKASSRDLFVSYDREPDADDDVYRLDDTTLYRMNADGGSNIDISSIAYYGTVTTGKLLAGDADPVAGSPTVQVRRSSNPFDSSPRWQLSSVAPTGPGNARISWSPDGKIAYCGTGQSPGASLDESAFSGSLDGDKWRQFGLMDTTINLADIVPAPDSKSLFITTYSSFSPEGVWRSAGDPLGKYWERLLTMDTSTDAVILRLSASYPEDSTMYAAEVGGKLLAVSHNRGNSWRWYRGPGPAVDMVVEDEETAYVALPGGHISKTTDCAWIWQEPVDTGLSEINMLAIAEEETILVGGRNGEIAYSTDGGDSFSQIGEVICSGDVQVVADANYKENGIIYAATNSSDEGIWRWSMGVSAEWEQIDASISEVMGGQRIGGLAIGIEGTLYALKLEPASDTSGGVLRSLNPSTRELSEIEFDLINDALPAGITCDPTLIFPNTLPYLKLSGNSEQNELWTIDTVNQTIYWYQDSLCKLGPTLDTPANGVVIPLDPCRCVASLALHWEELSETEIYKIALYLDSDVTQLLWSGSSDDTDVLSIADASFATLISGTTYYWRVRSTEPIMSPWSKLRSFTPALADTAQQPATAAPAGLSPSSGATGVSLKPAFTWNSVARATSYEFILARDSEYTNVVVAMTGDDALPTTSWGYDGDMDYSTTYFWKVRAISDTSYGGWVTGVFTTEAAPTPPSTPQISLTPPPPVEPVPPIPAYLLWIMIGMGIALVAALLVLITRTRR